MARTDFTTGTSFRGPLYVVDADGNELVLTPNATALPAAVDDDSTGTADTADFTLVEVTDTTSDVSGLINNNFATLAALLDRILDRIQ